MNDAEIQKKKAADKAIEYVKNGHVVGLGTGRTAAYAIEKLAVLINENKIKNIIGIPSSVSTARLAQEYGIALSSLDEHPRVDITIDGADEVDANLNMIKGGGGALLREKVLAQASDKLIIIVDEGKVSEKLGKKWPVPVEIIPFAYTVEKIFLESISLDISVRTKDDGSLFHTDQGNLILDCYFGEIDDPQKLAEILTQRAGIMEHGLFLGLATEIIVGTDEEVRFIRRK